VKMISNVSYLFPFFGCRSKFSTIAVAVTTEDSYWCCTGVALPPWGMSCWLYCSPWLTSQQHSFDPWLRALGIKLFSHSACLATLDWLLQKKCMVVSGNSTKKKNPLPAVHSKNNETLIVVRSDLSCLIVPWHLPINPPSALWTHDNFEHVLIIICWCFLFQVGDFGLARWQPDGDCGVDTQVIGTFGWVISLFAADNQQFLAGRINYFEKEVL
jgi:hypothetical protein